MALLQGHLTNMDYVSLQDKALSKVCSLDMSGFGNELIIRHEPVNIDAIPLFSAYSCLVVHYEPCK